MTKAKSQVKKAGEPQEKKVNTPAAESTTKPAEEITLTGTESPAEGSIKDNGYTDSAAEDIQVQKGDNPEKKIDKGAVIDKKSKLENAMKQRAKQVFASHSVDILYFTEDNTAFLEPQYARIHAESLKSQRVIIIERKEIR
jgi:hypothetical protein